MNVPAPRQILLLLDVDDDMSAAEIWPHLPSGEDRHVLPLSRCGAPRLNRREEPRKPVDWYTLERAVKELVKQARSLRTLEGPAVQYYICGLAPLPVFFCLGRELPARSGQQTFINRRKDQTWDVLSLSLANAHHDAFFDVVRGLAEKPESGAQRRGMVAIFISTMGAPAPDEMLRSLIRQQETELLGVVEVRTSQFGLLDHESIGAATEQLAQVFSRIQTFYPEAHGVVIFVAGPAQLAFLAGRLLPNTVRDVWFANHRPAYSDYELAYPARPANPWQGMVTIKSVEITNLRSFENLSFGTIAHPSDAGQWTLLLGENGAGKTTILRALALALTDPGTTTGIQRTKDVPIVRHGQKLATVKVKTSSRTFGVEIEGDPGHETVSPDKNTGDIPERMRPWVVGYGCRRGSALGGPDEKVSFSAAEEVDTLFYGTQGLIHAEAWLKGLVAAGPSDKRFAVVQRVLCGSKADGMLPGVRSIMLKDDRIWVEGPTVPRTLLEGLSDGYITTAGWVIDLLARWLNRCKRLQISVGERFNEEMEGLVLIDEIDMHLHPLWQTKVIEMTRRFFPRLSFVATTHNPLTLTGAGKGEIFVLRRKEDATAYELQQIDLVEGSRVDQVLTGYWFGLSSVLMDRETADMLERHRQLLQGGVRRDDPMRIGLEDALRRRLGSYADTSTERMALSVAAKLMAEERKPVTPEERARFKEKLEAIMRQKIASGKRDGSL